MSYDPYATRTNKDGSQTVVGWQPYEGYSGASQTSAPQWANYPGATSGLAPGTTTATRRGSSLPSASDPRWVNRPGDSAVNYGSIYDYWNNQLAAPINAAFNQRAAQLAASRAGISSSINQQRALARQGYDIALQRLGLREQGNLYDIDLANQQVGFLDEGWGLAQERYRSDKAYLDKLRSFATRDYNREMGYLGEQEGFAGRARDNTLAQIGLDFARSVRLARSDATARGAITSAGFRDTVGEFRQQRDISTAGAELDYDERMAAIRNARGALGSKYERELADLDKQGVDLDFDLRQTDLSVREQRAVLDNRLKQLDLLAQDFGLQRAELANQLQKGLAALGLQEKQALAQITDALASNEAQRIQAAMGVVSAAHAAAQQDIASGTRRR